MNDERVRYGRVGEKRIPKNTLFTAKSEDGETIYFGIARCNSKADDFKREVGTYVAGERQLKAYQDFNERKNSWDYYFTGTIDLHKSGLRGKVDRKYVKVLLEYFKDIDQHLLKRYNESKRK